MALREPIGAEEHQVKHLPLVAPVASSQLLPGLGQTVELQLGQERDLLGDGLSAGGFGAGGIGPAERWEQPAPASGEEVVDKRHGRDGRGPSGFRGTAVGHTGLEAGGRVFAQWWGRSALLSSSGMTYGPFTPGLQRAEAWLWCVFSGN